jgi:hypothetical protein
MASNGSGAWATFKALLSSVLPRRTNDDVELEMKLWMDSIALNEPQLLADGFVLRDASMVADGSVCRAER